MNIGYRLSAFGFLASDKPKIDGNFGFKDQWLALLWVRDNISAFGGTIAIATNVGARATGVDYMRAREPRGYTAFGLVCGYVMSRRRGYKKHAYTHQITLSCRSALRPSATPPCIAPP